MSRLSSYDVTRCLSFWHFVSLEVLTYHICNSIFHLVCLYTKQQTFQNSQQGAYNIALTNRWFPKRVRCIDFKVTLREISFIHNNAMFWLTSISALEKYKYLKIQSDIQGRNISVRFETGNIYSTRCETIPEGCYFDWCVHNSNHVEMSWCLQTNSLNY